MQTRGVYREVITVSGVHGIRHVEAGRVLAASTLEIAILASIESICALGAFFASSTSFRNDRNSSIIPLTMSTTGRPFLRHPVQIYS